MLAGRLVKLIEKNSEQLARELSEKVWNSPRCSDLHKVPPDELRARTREIYDNLSNWLDGQDRSRMNSGTPRSAPGVLNKVWPIATSSGRLRPQKSTCARSFNERDYRIAPWSYMASWSSCISLNQFFDRALYFTAVGYERERARIGSNLATQEDHQKVYI
ncbi:MAG: hypothetical protein MRJ68_10975 [Nitrospira sp.]|nr:hypothetical protein [Nitrospira sp.]